MTQDAKSEHAWWDFRAQAGRVAAVCAIAGDDSAWSGPVLERCLGLITPEIDLSPGAKVLDLGCGIGRLTIPFALRHPECRLIGVDISEHMLSLAEASTPSGCEIKWLLGDGRKLPDTGPLQGAFSMITFQHIPREAAADYVKQVGERLLPGGAFRFQIYEGTDTAFLFHQANEEWAKAACAGAGLRLSKYERLPANNSTEICPWVTATKP